MIAGDGMLLHIEAVDNSGPFWYDLNIQDLVKRHQFDEWGSIAYNAKTSRRLFVQTSQSEVLTNTGKGSSLLFKNGRLCLEQGDECLIRLPESYPGNLGDDMSVWRELATAVRSPKKNLSIACE